MNGSKPGGQSRHAKIGRMLTTKRVVEFLSARVTFWAGNPAEL